MKMVRSMMGVLMMVLIVSFASDSLAQGRGHGHNKPGRGHNQDDDDQGDHGKGYKKYRGHDRDYKYRSDRGNTWARDDRGKHYSRGKYVVYKHNHRSNRRWAPVYGHYYNTRYIYYRDYNVYYDCYRDVFVTWTGGNWVVSSHVPVVLARVDFGRTTVVGVDYWDDDFNFYLTRRRPAYISIEASF